MFGRCWMCEGGTVGAVVQRFRDDADAEHRALLLVEQLHLPFRILPELARDPGGHVGAGARQRAPSIIAVGAFGAELRCAGVAAVADAKEVERHAWADATAAPDRWVFM